MKTDRVDLNGADARLEGLAECARQPVEFGFGSHGGPVLKLRRLPDGQEGLRAIWVDDQRFPVPSSVIDHLAQEPGWIGLPTLAEHAEMVRSDPLDGVPMQGLLRIAWAATRAGFRDAWRRLDEWLRAL